MKRLRPFFSFFGSKWRLAPYYPAPNHNMVIEPFAGSASYSLLHHSRKIVLVEKNPDLCAVWRFLIDATPEEIRRLPLIRPTQTISDLGPLHRGAEVLIRLWLCRAFSSALPSKPNAWMKKHYKDYPSSFWGKEVRERIASQVEKIKHWVCIESDYSWSPDLEATWFIDPPYLVAGKGYAFGSDQIDFKKLATFCRQRQGQVVVCENQGANWLPFKPFTNTHGLRKQSKEAIFLQGS